MAALRRGAVVVIPTDTVYGLAARADDADAMARLFELKGRDADKSIAVLVGDLGQARSLTTHRLDRFAPFWPGPLTVVVPRAADAVLYIGTDDSTVGIRCPDDAFVRRLALEVGPDCRIERQRERRAYARHGARDRGAVSVGLDRRRRRPAPRRGIDGDRRHRRSARSCCGPAP